MHCAYLAVNLDGLESSLFFEGLGTTAHIWKGATY